MNLGKILHENSHAGLFFRDHILDSPNKALRISTMGETHVNSDTIHTLINQKMCRKNIENKEYPM